MTGRWQHLQVGAQALVLSCTRSLGLALVWRDGGVTPIKQCLPAGALLQAFFVEATERTVPLRKALLALSGRSVGDYPLVFSCAAGSRIDAFTAYTFVGPWDDLDVALIDDPGYFARVFHNVVPGKPSFFEPEQEPASAPRPAPKPLPRPAPKPDPFQSLSQEQLNTVMRGTRRDDLIAAATAFSELRLDAKAVLSLSYAAWAKASLSADQRRSTQQWLREQAPDWRGPTGKIVDGPVTEVLAAPAVTVRQPLLLAALQGRVPTFDMSVQVLSNPPKSTTSFQALPSGDGGILLQPVIRDLRSESSYGEFNVSIRCGADAAATATQVVTVLPDNVDRVPERLQVVSAVDETRLIPSTVYVVSVAMDGRRKIVHEAATDAEGCCELAAALPDGTYEVVVYPTPGAAIVPPYRCALAGKVIFRGLRSNGSFIAVHHVLPGINPWGEVPDPDIFPVPRPAGRPVDSYLVKERGLLGLGITLLQLTTEGTYSKLRAELDRIGLKVHWYVGPPPSLVDFRKALASSCQLWIISHAIPMLNGPYIDEIKLFYSQGNGLYLWGDNAPYFADVNPLAGALFRAQLSGNDPGQQVVPANGRDEGPGLASHPVTTFVPMLYEGITISSVMMASGCPLKPLVRSSVGKIVTAYFDGDSKRALLDGGFTRLWDDYWTTTGTAPFVSNSAGWLANLDNRRDRVEEAYSRASAEALVGPGAAT